MSQMPSVLITGAYGFVGHKLCQHLIQSGYQVDAWVREIDETKAVLGVRYFGVGNFDHSTTDRMKVLLSENPVDYLCHLAARVHQMSESSVNKRAKYLQTNFEFTKRLYLAASQSSLKRFIFLSSVKVMGENSETEVDERNIPAPQDEYAESKRAAEIFLEGESNKVMRTYIFRVPLVYGEGVKGNFRSLYKIIRKKLPLPFLSIQNRRSMLFVGNLCSAIERTFSIQPSAPSGTYFITDGSDWSTPDLIRNLGQAIGTPVFLFRFPTFWMSERLTQSFFFSGEKFKRDFSWEPPFKPQDGLKHLMGEVNS